MGGSGLGSAVWWPSSPAPCFPPSDGGMGVSPVWYYKFDSNSGHFLNGLSDSTLAPSQSTFLTAARVTVLQQKLDCDLPLLHACLYRDQIPNSLPRATRPHMSWSFPTLPNSPSTFFPCILLQPHQPWFAFTNTVSFSPSQGFGTCYFPLSAMLSPRTLDKVPFSLHSGHSSKTTSSE